MAKKRKKPKKRAKKKSGKKKKSRRPAKRKAKRKAKSASVPQARPKRKKPAKGIGRREWGPIRRALLEKRGVILNAMKRIRNIEVSTDVGDEADQAGLSLEKELLFELSDNERNQLDQIEGALRKMDKGTFGRCEHCREPIDHKRVRALPFARYCMDCQSRTERAPHS